MTPAPKEFPREAIEMFVHRTHGVVVAVGALVLGACTDPTQRTDLRPDGPPEVLAVLVMNDAAANLLESATFCKTKAPNDGSANTGDEKRPGLVGLPDFSSHQICPDDLTKGVDELTDAAPQGWYVRLMFDELLNPDIEDLIPIDDDNGQPTGTYTGTIANTHPVT